MSSSEEPQPDWSLLPHDPAGFFALSDPIDRKDLKRAYNKLLRRFKPEKAPEEFQRIRAAYESLDERLRYGDRSAAMPTAPVDWNASQEPATPTPATASADISGYEIINQSSTPQPLPKTLDERLDDESPQELYAELSAAPDKSPYDYYALAVLSDIVDRGKPLRFVEWLLSGLAKHHDSGPLWRLLHDYLRGPLPDGAEEKLLPAIARIARDDSFYPLTEPLWLALLREPTEGDPVERVAQLLQRCEREIRDERIAGRMAFYTQLAKASLLAGDHPWPSEALDYLEANFEHAPPWLEADLDMLGVMREYLAVRARFAAKHPLCRRLDAALRDYFLQDQQEGDRAVVAAQVAITEDLDALMAAFPLSDNDLHEHFFPLWRWVSWDVGERNAPPQSEQDGQIDWNWRVRELLRKIGAEANGSWLGQRWSFGAAGFEVAAWASYVVAIAGLAAILFGVSSLIWEELPDWMIGPLVLGPLGGGIAAGWWASKKIKGEPTARFNSKMSVKLYERYWRPRVLEFQQHSHLDDRDFRSRFSQGVNPTIPLSDYINMYVQQDYAPAVLSTAQRFLA